GTGELIVRTGEGAKAPAAGELLLGVLKGQLAGQLTDQPGDPVAAKTKPESAAWFEAATKAAESEDTGGFHVTRVAPDVAGGRIAVESRFVARFPNGRWETVWHHTEVVDAARADKVRTEQIA